jgi:hypothetical protein
MDMLASSGYIVVNYGVAMQRTADFFDTHVKE